MMIQAVITWFIPYSGDRSQMISTLRLGVIQKADVEGRFVCILLSKTAEKGKNPNYFEDIIYDLPSGRRKEDSQPAVHSGPL